MNLHDFFLVALALACALFLGLALYEAINHPPKPKVPDVFYQPRPTPRLAVGKVLVFAGNYREYSWWLNWQRQYDRRLCRFIERPEHIAGLHPENIMAIERVGQYWQHPAWREPQVQHLLHRYEVWKINGK